MRAFDFLEGLAFFAVITVPVLVAAWLLLRAFFAHLGGSAAVLAYAVLVTAGLVAVHLLPGLAGVIVRWSVALCSLALLAAVVWLTRGRMRRGYPRLKPIEWTAGPLLGAVAVGVAVVAALTAALAATVVPSTDVDTLTFHLPNIAEWIQTGSVWRADHFTPLLANGNYPQNGDLLSLWVVLPFSDDAFVRPLGFPLAMLAGVSVYALARQAGALRPPAALSAALFTTIPVLTIAAYEGAKTDMAMLAMFGAGSFFLLRHLAEQRRSDLVLAGLGLGLAFGTKWYGLWSVGGVVLSWVVVWLVARRPSLGVVARAVGVLGGLVLAAGGIWLVRNVALSGSPLYPSPVRPLGLTIFGAPRDYVRECGGFSVAGYATDPHIWRHFILPAYRSGYGLAGFALAFGWVAAVIALVRQARARGVREVALAPAVLVLAAPLLALAYAVTPYSAIGPKGQPFVEANLRWLLPCLMMAAAAGAWALSRLRRGQVAAYAVGLLVVGLAVARAYYEPLVRQLAVAVGVALGVAIVLGALRAWRSGRPRLRALAAAGVAVTLAALGAGAYARQHDFNAHRYDSGGDPVVAALAGSGDDHRHVGLAGVWNGNGLSPVLPAFGPRLRGRVDFVGYTVRGQLREYPTQARFLRAVRTGGYDLVVVGRGNEGYGGCPLPGSETDEHAWMAASGYQLVAETARLSLWQAPPG